MTEAWRLAEWANRLSDIAEDQEIHEDPTEIEHACWNLACKAISRQIRRDAPALIAAFLEEASAASPPEPQAEA